MGESFALSQEFRFEAAHRLPNVPAEHKCARLHGHSFKVTVWVEGPLEPRLGWVMDYAQIREVVAPLLERTLDHRYLNDIPGLENPTSEHLARFLWLAIAPRLPGLAQIDVAETCQTSCRYRGAVR